MLCDQDSKPHSLTLHMPVRTDALVSRAILSLVGAASLLLAACQHPAGDQPVGRPSSSIGGTSWELVAISAAPDGQGSLLPPTPENYTITFDIGGAAALTIDCNRGVGPWRVDHANATGGILSIGPITATEMLCPKPSLGDALRVAIAKVTRYTISNDRLVMSLGNGTGTIVWRKQLTE